LSVMNADQPRGELFQYVSCLIFFISQHLYYCAYTKLSCTLVAIRLISSIVGTCAVQSCLLGTYCTVCNESAHTPHHIKSNTINLFLIRPIKGIFTSLLYMLKYHKLNLAKVCVLSFLIKLCLHQVH